MSKSKYTDAVCIILIVVMLAVTLLFCFGKQLGLQGVERVTALESAGSSSVISLDDAKCRIKGTGAYRADNAVVIAYAGEYTLTGKLTDGQIIVNADGKSRVKLILAGVDIHCSDGPAIYVKNADKVTIETAPGSKNTLSSGERFSEENILMGVNAGLYSEDDLILSGSGELNVRCDYQHGIVGKDDVSIKSGSIAVNALTDGIRGRDSLTISGGSIKVVSGNNGLLSNNDLDPEKGVIVLSGGTLDITSGGDGIQARTALSMADGDVTVRSGGGSALGKPDEPEHVSTKGVKAGTTLTVNGGKLWVDSADDSLHAGGAITLGGGTLTLSSGDDAVHSDVSVAYSATELTVTDCREGIEAVHITIESGTININSRNDGINANGKSRGVNMSTMHIHGGSIHLRTQADGLDSNGDIIITDGEVYISSQPSDGNTAVDYGIENGGSCLISGGTVVACGFSELAESFTGESEQCSLLYCLADSVAGGTAVSLFDESGKLLLSYAPENTYNCVILSCPGMHVGGTYTVTVGEQSGSFTLDSTAVRVGLNGIVSAADAKPSMPPMATRD